MSSSDNNNQNQHVVDDDEAVLGSLPSGFRFSPSDEQLLVSYLLKKVLKQKLPPNRMKEVLNLYDYNPEVLTGKYKGYNAKQWYFFSRRYENEKETYRVAGDGYWLVTSNDFVSTKDNVVIASKKTSIYHHGNYPEGLKSSFMMEEYIISLQCGSHDYEDTAKVDDWVLCGIKKSLKRSMSDSSMEGSYESDEEGGPKCDGYDTESNDKEEEETSPLPPITPNNELDHDLLLGH